MCVARWTSRSTGSSTGHRARTPARGRTREHVGERAGERAWQDVIVSCSSIGSPTGRRRAGAWRSLGDGRFVRHVASGAARRTRARAWAEQQVEVGHGRSDGAGYACSARAAPLSGTAGMPAAASVRAPRQAVVGARLATWTARRPASRARQVVRERSASPARRWRCASSGSSPASGAISATRPVDRRRDRRRGVGRPQQCEERRGGRHRGPPQTRASPMPRREARVARSRMRAASRRHRPPSAKPTTSRRVAVAMCASAYAADLRHDCAFEQGERHLAARHAARRQLPPARNAVEITIRSRAAPRDLPPWRPRVSRATAARRGALWSAARTMDDAVGVEHRVLRPTGSPRLRGAAPR